MVGTRTPGSPQTASASVEALCDISQAFVELAAFEIKQLDIGEIMWANDEGRMSAGHSHIPLLRDDDGLGPSRLSCVLW